MHEYEGVLTSGFVRYKIKVGYDITGAKIMGDKIRVAIVEDEQEAAKKLISFFNKYAYENSVLFETELCLIISAYFFISAIVKGIIL